VVACEFVQHIISFLIYGITQLIEERFEPSFCSFTGVFHPQTSSGCISGIGKNSSARFVSVPVYFFKNILVQKCMFLN
jgi:hypothetical protein